MPMPVVLYCILINRVLKLLVYFYIIVLLCFLLYFMVVEFGQEDKKS